MTVSKKHSKTEALKLPALRTLALSDLHLGRKMTHARTPDVIEPLVEGFDRVLLLGDIVDHWYTSAEAAKDFEERIRDICNKAGVKDVIYFRGNHDACQEDAEEFALFDGVLYLHGHAVYNNLKGEGGAAERIKKMNAKKYGPHLTESRANKTGWEFIEHMYGRIPMKLIIPFKFPWHVRMRIKALADEVAPPGEVRGVVLGHSHRPGVGKYRGLKLFNLGGWITNTRAYGFTRQGSDTRLVQIDTRGKVPKWGKVLHECSL